MVGLVAVWRHFERERVTVESKRALAERKARRVTADERRAVQNSQRMHP